MIIWLIKDSEQLPLIPNSKPGRTWRLGEELSRRGHTVIWWSSNFHHILKKKVCPENIDYKVNNHFTLKLLDCGTYQKNLSLGRIVHHWRFGKKISKEMRRLPKPDRIIAAHPSIESSYEATKYGKEFNVPTIVDVRDMWPDIFYSHFPKPIQFLFKIIFKTYIKKTFYSFNSCDALVSMSPDILSWGQKKLSLNKKHSSVFYLGVDESSTDKKHLKNPLRQKLKDKVIYLYLGVFGKSYDIETIIKSAKKRWDNGDRKSFFIIAGDGPKKEKLKKLALGYDNIYFPGWVDRTQSMFFLGICDVFLIPNTTIAMPNKFFEGLLHNKPILFTFRGFGRTLLEKYKAGRYYRPGNIQGLLKLIQETSCKNQRKEMSAHAKKLYLDNFSSKKIYSDYANFIEELKK